MVLGRIKTYGELVMFSHTLFSIPFGLIAMLLAADGFPSFRLTFWILVALISARTLANAINRLVDKNIDARNPRTAGRHMPQGLVKTREVLLLILACLALLIVSAFMINPLCVVLLPVPMFLFFVYSFTKRFTWACHLVLGAACACAPVGAWMAVAGNISWVSFVLGAVVTLWVAGFDIIYGVRDVDFDREEDLFSIPSVFGVKNALIISFIFHAVAVLLLVYTGLIAALGRTYFAGICIAAGLLLYEHLIVSPTNLKNVTIASYSINQIVSIVLLIFSGADILIK